MYRKNGTGPLIAQTTITPAASRKVDARAAASEVRFARSPKNFEMRDGSSVFFSLLKTTSRARGETNTVGESSAWEELFDPNTHCATATRREAPLPPKQASITVTHVVPL
jgi:hypothetical protein